MKVTLIMIIMIAFTGVTVLAENPNATNYFDRNNAGTPLEACSSSWRPQGAVTTTLGEMSEELGKLIEAKAESGQIDLAFLRLQYFYRECGLEQLGAMARLEDGPGRSALAERLEAMKQKIQAKLVKKDKEMGCWPLRNFEHFEFRTNAGCALAKIQYDQLVTLGKKKPELIAGNLAEIEKFGRRILGIQRTGLQALAQKKGGGPATGGPEIETANASK
ncbi:MAG: hypothetical protein AB7G93_17420 [Bdellovibrionales bacterium]